MVLEKLVIYKNMFEKDGNEIFKYGVILEIWDNEKKVFEPKITYLYFEHNIAEEGDKIPVKYDVDKRRYVIAWGQI